MTENPLQSAVTALITERNTARGEIERLQGIITSTTNERVKQTKKVNDITAAITQIEGLIKAQTLPATYKTVRVDKYWLASRTNSFRPGHYVERFADGTWKCTCKGYRYNGSCWAINQLKGMNADQRIRAGHLYKNYDFDQRRDEAARKA